MFRYIIYTHTQIDKRESLIYIYIYKLLTYYLYAYYSFFIKNNKKDIYIYITFITGSSTWMIQFYCCSVCWLARAAISVSGIDMISLDCSGMVRILSSLSELLLSVPNVLRGIVFVVAVACDWNEIIYKFHFARNKTR